MSDRGLDDEKLSVLAQWAAGLRRDSRAEVAAATAELNTLGTFKDGIFRRNDDVASPRNVDGYQAIWEHVHGRRMIYPKPRYRDPIILDPANYEWLPVEASPGVTEKPLGTFTERRCAATLVRIAAGSACRLGGRSIYLVMTGAGTVQDRPYRSLTAIHVDAGETATLAAREQTEMVQFLLPDLSGLQVRQRSPAEAAE